MKQKILMGFMIPISIIFSSCNSNHEATLVDPNATTATKTLYQKLLKSTEQGILIGHQGHFR